MRCVIVLPDGQEDRAAPAPLINGLSRRGMAITVTQGSAPAMVQLSRASSAALVIVEPDRLADVKELVHAVRMYHPSVICWQFQQCGGQDVGKLSVINGRYHGDNPRETSTHRAPPGEPSEVQESARQRVEPLVHRIDRQPQRPSPLITEEELAMLLGDDPLEENLPKDSAPSG